MELRIISIGTLSIHPNWGEGSPVRTGHATTSLIRSGDRVVLVDPGLPEQMIGARLQERAGIRPDAVTDVFLTRFHPEVWRGIGAFANARWLIGGRERESVGVPLASHLKRAMEEGDDETVEALRQHIAILHRCEAAPDRLAPGLDLFPLYGVSPGLCGLLIDEARHTTLICGDAVATIEHLLDGKVLRGAADINQAKESFAEAIEIADLLVLGRDNMVVNPTKRPF
ncbi:MAG: MBL fold metallo-hydrolase [Phycisphaerales bacterium]|nr:MBL fold metallo-hydrolase [Phycisphaerales bacterium]